MDECFDPVALRLIGIIKRTLPDYGDEDICWGYHFVTGALMYTFARTVTRLGASGRDHWRAWATTPAS